GGDQPESPEAALKELNPLASPAVPTPDPGPSVTATLISGGVPGLLGGPHSSRKLTGWGRGSLWLQTPHPRGFLPGAVVNLTAVTPEKAVKLAASDVRQQLLEEGSLTPAHGAQWNLKLEMLAGCGAGLCQAAVTCPLEMLKILLQRAGRLASPFLSAVSTHMSLSPSPGGHGDRAPPRPATRPERLGAQHGRPLLRGDIPFSVIYFPLFAKLNLLGVREPTGKASFAHSFTSSCVAGPVTPLQAEYIAGGAA
ncbi:hypothetical protein E2I00_014025, partial [Balaenoptera physalus]